MLRVLHILYLSFRREGLFVSDAFGVYILFVVSREWGRQWEIEWKCILLSEKVFCLRFVIFVVTNDGCCTPIRNCSQSWLYWLETRKCLGSWWVFGVALLIFRLVWTWNSQNIEIPRTFNSLIFISIQQDYPFYAL